MPDLDALEAISTGQVPGFIYARDNHPNGVQLEAELAQLEKAAGAIVCSNGMAAIATVALATLQQGSRVLASDQLYGRTTQLFFQELPRWGIEISAVDTTNLVAVEQALAAGPVSLFLVETLSNPLLAVAPLRELIALAEKYHTEILVDNTFASPALCRPTELGADYTMESLTKIIGGHSDITLGAVVVKDVARLARLRQVRSIWGWMGDSFPCWLSLRGLPTLPL
ncbi:MAG TPA: aminotransferase class I/II-fold pyridoxal phosphate-dependent enzyme, partial [Gemmatales bacterium]|nr:aminotransferase class I/II-fold pyridoxal phosphate-dependent enzyme [Gemmatales bacterium]